ncbi:retinoblastoma-like protein 2 [Gadus chalcogrammus]|uniref:retinoblastoma-like protein 2 n=1 Tax=Gadus chalcogrammus TaxID=1042646 RepID=UPI0024C4A4EB|nr:retinoblastoma-like protein 2 [Gadus chalcogrammus]
MSDEDEFMQKARTGFEDLCRALNMDEEASSEAWKSYENINRNYTLEGSELHWLACALYVACRSSVPTVGKGTAEGNYVSLTRILRCSEQSLVEFFSKMKKWQDMASVPTDFRQSTEKLERNFTVSAVIFKKYVPIFRSIFKAPPEEPPRVHRSRKQRRHPCTVSEVFNFSWILFIHAKGNFPMISDDLVNSYHLLLCALDLVFTNALLCNARKDLLNPDFRGLPEEFGSKDYRPAPGSYCLLGKLCELNDGLVLEAKGVKEHFWKPFIKMLFHKRILKGREDTLTGFLDPMNFGDSFSSLSRVYEEHVLSTGSLDERIFTGEGANEDIGTPAPCLSEAPENQDSAAYRLHASLTATALKVSTPLSSRRYPPDPRLSSPVSSAIQSVGRLHSLLTGATQGPSAKLTQILRACARDPSDVISTRLKDMFQTFCQHYEDQSLEGPGMGKDVAVKFFRLGEALYYKMLEAIVEREKMILGEADLSGILEQDIFHGSLMACCLEIVIFSYRPPGDFPNILNVFKIQAYHFYKVIEVLVRAEQGLFREVVKHLNHVEETVVERLAWGSQSPLWDSLRNAKGQVPTCQEVMPPRYLEESEAAGGRSNSSPITPVTRGPDLSANSTLKGVSPSPTGLLDRYNSPPSAVAPHRRRLFVDTTDAQPTLVTVQIPLQGITFFPLQMIPGQGSTTLHPISAQALTGTISGPSPAPKPPSRPASVPLRKGSLSLFFRKVYHLASLRLRDLCSQLDISRELRQKIWSCFEYSLVHCTELLMNRHLDQLLMCAVYVMAKVTREDRSFQNIMKCYRTQPQACSTVYRSVLISESRRNLSDGSKVSKLKSPSTKTQEQGVNLSTPPSTPSSTSTPSTTSTSSTSLMDQEERGDLICFYNQVYITPMRPFALRYSLSSPSAGAESPPLCPYPSVRCGAARRVQLSSKHCVYVSPHGTSGPATPPPRHNIYYYISNSPSDRLREINSMIRTGQSPSRKHSLPLEEEPEPKKACPENQSALLRRLQDVANDRSSSH